MIALWVTGPGVWYSLKEDPDGCVAQVWPLSSVVAASTYLTQFAGLFREGKWEAWLFPGMHKRGHLLCFTNRLDFIVHHPSSDRKTSLVDFLGVKPK